MEKQDLEAVIAHLRELNSKFYGEITIKIRDGKVVIISELRTIKVREQDK